MNISRKCTREPYSFLSIETTLPANRSLTLFKMVGCVVGKKHPPVPVFPL